MNRKKHPYFAVVICALILSAGLPAARAQGRHEKRQQRITESAAVSNVLGGVSFQTSTLYDRAYEAVLDFLKRQGYTIESAGRETGQIVTSITVTGGYNQTGTRVQVTLLKDDEATSTVRVAVVEQKRKKLLQTEPWGDPRVNEEKSAKVRNEIKSALSAVSSAAPSPAPVAAPQNSAPPSDPKVLTNTDVIRLSKNGLGEGVIIGAIQGSKCQFDLSVDGLIQLKNAGVSQRVMEAMQATVSSQPAVTATGQPSPALNQSLNTPKSGAIFVPRQADDLYAHLVMGETRQRLVGTHTHLAAVKVKGQEMTLASLAANAAVGEAVTNVLTQASAKVLTDVMLSSVGRSVLFPTGTLLGSMAGGVLAAGMATGKLFGRQSPTITAVLALDRSHSSTLLQTTQPQFEIFYGDIPGIDPDGYQPAIVKLTVTRDNYRLRGATRIKDSKLLYDGFVEESVTTQVQKLGRGHLLLQPQLALAPGEYGLVLTPVNQKNSLSGENPQENALFLVIWDFSVGDLKPAPLSTSPASQSSPASNFVESSSTPGSNSFVAQNTSATTSGSDHKSDEDKRADSKTTPQIQVAANVEKVRSVIIKGMTEAKYTLDKEDQHQLVFKKRTGGASGFMAGALLGRDQENPFQILTFIMTEQDGGTLVLAKAGILYPDRNNQGIPRDVDGKKIRKELYKNLDEIKALAEKQ